MLAIHMPNNSISTCNDFLGWCGIHLNMKYATIGTCVVIRICQTWAAVPSSASWVIPKTAAWPITKINAPIDIVRGSQALTDFSGEVVAIFVFITTLLIQVEVFMTLKSVK